jgi:hypothetical protein
MGYPVLMVQANAMQVPFHFLAVDHELASMFSNWLAISCEPSKRSKTEEAQRL